MQKQWTKFIVVVLAVAVVVGSISLFANWPVSRAGQELKSTVGYVDIEKIFNSHPDKAQAEQKLNEEARELEEQYKAEEKDLTEEEKKQRLAQYQSQLALREKQLINGIILKIRDTIKEVAEAKGITVVLEKKNIIYGGTDLTEDVLAKIKAENAGQEESK